MYRATIEDRTAEHSRVLHALAEDSVPKPDALRGGQGPGRSLDRGRPARGRRVVPEAIEEDYLKSNDLHRRYEVKRSDPSGAGMSAEVTELLDPLFGARSVYLAAAFAAIEENWGTTDRYLSEG